MRFDALTDQVFRPRLLSMRTRSRVGALYACYETDVRDTDSMCTARQITGEDARDTIQSGTSRGECR